MDRVPGAAGAEPVMGNILTALVWAILAANHWIRGGPADSFWAGTYAGLVALNALSAYQGIKARRLERERCGRVARRVHQECREVECCAEGLDVERRIADGGM